MIKYFVVHVESPVKLFGLVLQQKIFLVFHGQPAGMPIHLCQRWRNNLTQERRLERREKKRRERKILEEWRQSAKEHSQNSVGREELFSDNQIVINQSYTEWNKLGC